MLRHLLLHETTTVQLTKAEQQHIFSCEKDQNPTLKSPTVRIFVCAAVWHREVSQVKQEAPAKPWDEGEYDTHDEFLTKHDQWKRQRDLKTGDWRASKWVDVWIEWSVCEGGGGGITLRVHLSAEINTGRAQQHGLGLMGGPDWQCWHLERAQ